MIRSVRSKQPIISPVASLGRYHLLLSDPYFQMGYITGHGGRVVETAVVALQLLHDDAVGNLVESGPSVFLGDVRTKGAMAPSPVTDAWEDLRLGSVLDDRADLLLNPSSGRITDQLVLLGEEVIHHVVIVTLIQVGLHGTHVHGANLRRRPSYT